MQLKVQYGDPTVIRCARDVYGEPTPYLTMYEPRKSRLSASDDSSQQ